MDYEIIELSTTDSTNRVASDLAKEGGKAFTAIVAENQTAGRGRLGKNWVSVQGKGLYFSVILRPMIELDKLASITLVIGLAVAEAIEDIVQNKIKIALKWPNDLYINGKKLGGILVEANTLSPNGKSCIIAGIGINLTMNNAELENITENAATSIVIETGSCPEKRNLLLAILSKLEKKIDNFEKYGFAPFFKYWQSRDYLINRRVTVVNTARKISVGRVVGIDEKGQMRLEDDEGRIHYVLSGDINLAK